MAWFSGKVSLGNFPDFSEAVSKISEGVKSIEKNFDNALGLEQDAETNNDNLSASSTSQGLWSTDLMSFMGQKDDNDNDNDDDEDGVKPFENVGSEEIHESLGTPLSSSREREMDESGDQGDATHEEGDLKAEALKAVEGQETKDMVLVSEEVHSGEEKSVEGNVIIDDQVHKVVDDVVDVNVALPEEVSSVVEEPSAVDHTEHLEFPDQKSTEHDPTSSEDQVAVIALERTEVGPILLDLQQSEDETKRQQEEEIKHEVSATETVESLSDVADGGKPSLQVSDDAPEIVRGIVSNATEHQAGVNEQGSSLERILPDNADSMAELEKVKRDMKLMETALLGAARQAQHHYWCILGLFLHKEGAYRVAVSDGGGGAREDVL